MNQNTEEIRLDLLMKKAVEGLTANEEKELQKLEAAAYANADESFEVTAAAISLVDIDASEQLPMHLRAKILSDADKFFSPVELHETIPAEKRSASGVSHKPKTSLLNRLGWAFAAVACMALAANIYFTRIQPDARVNVPPTPTPEQMLTPAQERERLMATAGDLITATWSPGDAKAPQNVAGDVVWSNSQQKGFVRFRGLPMNDKTKATYQLWIVDEGRGAKLAVDGGVFDANESGEIIVPIDAKLSIRKPVVFAVTSEEPGGVVQSDRPMVVVAKI
jgi:anti-sigma-K factor RskA